MSAKNDGSGSVVRFNSAWLRGKKIVMREKMAILSSAMLLIVGVIHLLPVTGVLGGVRLRSLYGIAFEEPNAALLMRHRAALFGLLGAFLIYAAFRPVFQAAAFVGGFGSVLSFLWLARVSGAFNEQIRRVVVVDIVALLCLIAGLAALLFEKGVG